SSYPIDDAKARNLHGFGLLLFRYFRGSWFYVRFSGSAFVILPKSRELWGALNAEAKPDKLGKTKTVNVGFRRNLASNKLPHN
ncbi:MAG: hypothetical protein IJL99_03220, partial [Firmicutes bacterium]|nr:hypothetical protein [Bacillota bacterium]